MNAKQERDRINAEQIQMQRGLHLTPIHQINAEPKKINKKIKYCMQIIVMLFFCSAGKQEMKEADERR